MYLKLKTKKETRGRGIKVLTVVPITALILSVMGLTSQTKEPDEVNNFSTVTTTTEIIIEETTMEATTETTTEEIIIEEPVVEEPKLDPVLSYDTSVKCNFTAEQYNKVLAGTPLEGDGNVFVDIENNYGVNGLFAISVAQIETSFGAAGVGSSRNNVFSNTKPGGSFIYFDNKIESVYYFAAYIPRVHWNNGRRSVSAIAPVYCDYQWGDTVESAMQSNYNKAIY